MKLNRLVQPFNSFKLSLYERQFEKLKVKANNMTIPTGDKRHTVIFPWIDRQKKNIYDLDALQAKVSNLGDMGQKLEREIQEFQQKEIDKFSAKVIRDNPLLESIFVRSRLRIDLRLSTHNNDKHKDGFKPGDDSLLR